MTHSFANGASSRGSGKIRRSVASLTPREQEVFEQLSCGRANKEIANSLSCSVRTVEFHISNLLRKLGVSSRLELVTNAQCGDLSALDSEAPFVEVRVFSGVAAAALGDTLVTLWKAPASLERWCWNINLLDHLAQSHADGVRCLSVVLPGSDAPDRVVRARIQADLAAFGKRLRRFVGVALGDSIWRSSVHCIMRAVFFMNGQADRLALTATVDKGLARVLEARGPSTPTRRELQLTVNELRRLLGVFVGLDAEPFSSDTATLDADLVCDPARPVRNRPEPPRTDDCA